MSIILKRNECTFEWYVSLSTAGSTTYVPDTNGSGRYDICTTEAVLDNLLGWYSIVSHVFPWAASFSNTVNTGEENENS